MNPNYTDIAAILDKSGSMLRIKHGVIEGVNGFIDEQKLAPGYATLTMIEFNDKYDEIYVRRPIQDVPALTEHSYLPKGSTALLDAIGRTINILGTAYSAMAEEDRPGHVVVVIQTDGDENSSQEFSLEMVKGMIQLQRDVYSWEFIFLGANQDAFGTARDLGIAADHTMTYAADGDGCKDSLLSVSNLLMTSRSVGACTRGFSDEAYSKQKR